MALSEQDQRRIIQQESTWTDSAFGGIDLSAYPALNELPPERSRDDGRFARDWRDTALSASASALRKFVADPDVEALERVGAETGHEDYRAEVRDRREETTAAAFKRACPSYLPTTRNYELIAQTLSFNALSDSQQEGTIEEQVAALIDGGHWTVTNLTACYSALNAEGLLDVAAGSARNLSTAERLKVTRLAQAWHVDQAIGEYLRCALDNEEVTLDMVNDPDHRQVCDEAVWNVFADITYDYVPTPEREAYLLRHCAGRPITLPLLQSAWSACRANEQRHQRGELLNSCQNPQAPETPTNLDALSDDAVTDLYHRSLKTYADQFRRGGPGVLA